MSTENLNVEFTTDDPFDAIGQDFIVPEEGETEQDEAGAIKEKEEVLQPIPLPFINTIIFDVFGSVFESCPAVEKARLNTIQRAFNPQKLPKDEILRKIKISEGLIKVINENGCSINPYKVLFELLGIEGLADSSYNSLVEKDTNLWRSNKIKWHSSIMERLIRHRMQEGYGIVFMLGNSFEPTNAVKDVLYKTFGNDIGFIEPCNTIHDFFQLSENVVYPSQCLIVGNDSQKHFIEPLSIGMNTCLVNNPKTKYRSVDFVRQLEINKETL